jgi:thiamine-monophosphate kinase
MVLLAAGNRGFADVVGAHQVPQPPYAAGVSAAQAGATAMSDISDGLLADLGHIAAASEVSIDIHRGALADPRLAEVAAALGFEAESWILTGGEDHGLVATFPPGHALPDAWRVVGAVADGSGVTVDGTPWRGSTGWQSFGG